MFGLQRRSDTTTERTTVADEVRAQGGRWWRLYGQVMFVTLVLAAFAYKWAPHPAPATIAVYFVLMVSILVRPVTGLYVITFLTLVGDNVVAAWYPFANNFSSRQSISFVSDSLVITPIEVMLVVTILAWLLHMYRAHHWTFRRGALNAPMMVFGGLVLFALGRAMVASGDNRVAVFEGRALVFLPVLYLLIVQLVDTRRQFVTLMVAALAGIIAQSFLAIQYYLTLDAEARSDLEALTEHAASVHVAALLLITVASWVIPGCSRALRWSMLLASIPAVVVFAIAQRRSAAVALAIGFVLLLVVLWRVRRRLLFVLVPLTVLLGAGYVVAFWNTTGPMGLGAQAFKSVVAPDELDRVDQNSSLYREIEAVDLWYTIHAAPLQGVGFGNPFYQPLALPHLEAFEFRNYIPHNTFLWIWLKLGVAGFIAMLFLFARAIQHGARSVVRLARGNDAALMMGAVGYVAMYLVFTYVDIGWEARSTVFLAVAMAWCADYLNSAPEPGRKPVPTRAPSARGALPGA